MLMNQNTKNNRRILLIAGLILLVLGVAGYVFYSMSKTIEVPEIALTAESEVKENDEDPNYTFYRLSDIKYQGGYLYVCDEGNNRIMKYDENGKFVLQIGRAGQGPGELLKPTSIAVHPDGTVFVLDGGNGRVQVFDSLGRYEKSFNIRTHLAGISLSMGRRLAVDSKKRIFLPTGRMSQSLLTFYSVDGTKLGEVGEKLTFSSQDRPWQRNNEILLTIDASDDIYVQFFSTPILRKYGNNGQLQWEKDFSNLSGVRQAIASVDEMAENNGLTDAQFSLRGFSFFVESVSDEMLIVLVAKPYLVDKHSVLPIGELRFFRDDSIEVFVSGLTRGPLGKFYVFEEARILRYSIPPIVTSQ